MAQSLTAGILVSANVRETSGGYYMYLTIDPTCSIHYDHVENHGSKGAYACHGINLRRGVINRKLRTCE